MGAGLKLLAFVLSALLVIANGTGHAVELTTRNYAGQPVLYIHGSFEADDGGRVADYLKAHPETREVHFHSPGGLLREGIAVGQVLRDASLATRVPGNAVCVSACVWAFLGGVIRIVDADAKFGVHMSTLIFNEELIGVLKEKLSEQSYEDIDVPLRYFMARTEKAAARAAADKAEHLVRMGVSLRLLAPGLDTDQWDVHWLSRRELRDYNVMNVE